MNREVTDTTMSRVESVLVALFLCVACPLTLFVVAWWTSASLSIPETAIPGWALAGLALGIVVVMVKRKRWVGGFYTVRTSLVIPVYLLWSGVAIMMFMGLPVGIAALGLLAGFYIGRKGHHARTEASLFETDARNVGLFTAAVVGFLSLAMGLLAVQEQHSMQAILATVGMSRLAATAAGRIMLVVAAVPVLAAIQYWLTQKVAQWGFRLGSGRT